MTMVIGIDRERPPRFPCRLYDCKATAAPLAIMCRKHWRVVPIPLQAQIRRLIQGTQVDPRRGTNQTNRWKILVSKAKVAVLQAQGKADAMTDELARLARLDPKSATVRGATANKTSKPSARGKRSGDSAGR